MKVILTGAAGRLGRAAAEALVAAGHAVRPLDRVAATVAGLSVEQVDLLDAAVTARALEGAEAVVHLANHPNVLSAPADVVYLENVTMNWQVFRAAARAGVRKIVFASSVQAIAGQPDEQARYQVLTPVFPLPADGDTPTRAGNPYGLSKIAGEEALRYVAETGGISGVAIRFPYLATPEQEPRLRERTGPEPLRPELCTWLALEAAGRLLVAVLAAELPGFRVYFPTMPRPAEAPPMRELLTGSGNYAGVARRRPVEEIDALVDISAITRETGWRP